VTSPAPAADPLLSEARSPARPGRTPAARRLGASMPTWDLIATKHLELRKRRGLMITVAVMIIAPTVLILGLRLAFHLFDPAHYGPAGDPTTFDGIANLTAEFGFIVAAVVGAAAATTDLNDGVFRYLVITGRSRLALYLARIPAGLAILVSALAIAFTMLCLVTAYESAPQPTTVSMNNGISIPANFDQAQLQTWVAAHPQQAPQAFQAGPGGAPVPPPAGRGIATDYTYYTATEDAEFNPAANEMAKIGLWLSLEIGIGFLVGLGLGSLTGQRTLSTILLIALEIIVTPIFARTQIPYFLNGQRLDVGVAMDQLRPAALAPANPGGGGPGPGGLLFGGRGALGIPPMATWAMISVIVGWIVVWSVLGAWRMMTRDA
jgi:hypothetical protein